MVVPRSFTVGADASAGAGAVGTVGPGDGGDATVFLTGFGIETEGTVSKPPRASVLTMSAPMNAEMTTKANVNSGSRNRELKVNSYWNSWHPDQTD